MFSIGVPGLIPIIFALYMFAFVRVAFVNVTFVKLLPDKSKLVRLVPLKLAAAKFTLGPRIYASAGIPELPPVPGRCTK